MTAPELESCPFCRCIPDGYEGRQVSCRCGAMGPIETSDDPESATWNDAHKHTQAAIAAAMMVVARHVDSFISFGNDLSHSAKMRIVADIKALIPADAAAALEAMLAEAEQRGFDRAKEQIACVIESRPAFWAGRAAAAIRAMKDKPPLRDPVNQVIAEYDQGGAA